ncbi:MAG: isochorismate synthase [Polyangiaceae bacterium]
MTDESRTSREPNFALSGPRGTLVTFDEAERVHGCHGEPRVLLRDAARALGRARLNGQRYLVGALPFSATEPVKLFVPAQVSRSFDVDIEAPSPRLGVGAVNAATHRDSRFVHLVQETLDVIERGDLEKAVIARSETLPLSRRPSVPTLLARLRRENPTGNTYALHIEDAERRDAYLVGSSPELLVSRRGERVVSIPLAGTCRRGRSRAEDAERTRALLESEKDRREHRLVVEEIVERLKPLSRPLKFSPIPSVIATPTLLHLATRIEGRLVDPATTALGLALALHPTAAVCGVPRAAAADYLARKEGSSRGFFTGTVGYVDVEGDGDWIVAIRCAVVTDVTARLFAGAGIVRGSVAEMEYLETEAKMHVMRQVFGLGSEP